MRDPDLVLRAQRAASALERAWDRYRTVHGLGADPMPPISSYVGYSLEEPWGEPRVVFGVAADEAEQLAALLESHDRDGRAAADLAAPADTQPPDEQDALSPHGHPGPGDSHVHVPAQPRPVPVKRPRAKEHARPERSRAGGQVQGPADQAASDEPGPPDAGEGGAGEPGAAADAPGLAIGPSREPGPGDRLEPMAFRPRHEPASFLDEGPEFDHPFLADPDDSLATGRGRLRAGGSHAAPRQRRASSSAAPRSGSGRSATRPIQTVSAELAGWVSGELPGQAAHRLAANWEAGPYAPRGGGASPRHRPGASPPSPGSADLRSPGFGSSRPGSPSLGWPGVC